jgi:endoglucanase
MPGASAGKLGRRSEQPGEFEIKVEAETVSAPQFAVWELPDFRRVRQQIHGRVCDDLIGVASILATLVALRRARAKVNVLGVLTRAEEVGFHGALALADSGRIPKEALVISLETSRELPPVRMGQGVILRVGDRASVFNSNATRFLAEVARELAEANKTFKVQRALMSGGTCEGTAYQEFGFETAAVCVALGNYHNCGPQDRIAVEFVDVRDALGMCDLLAAAARQMAHYREFIGRLPLRLRKLLTEARQRFGREAGA